MKIIPDMDNINYRQPKNNRDLFPSENNMCYFDQNRPPYKLTDTRTYEEKKEKNNSRYTKLIPAQEKYFLCIQKQEPT